MSEYSIQLTAEDSAMLATIKTQLGKLEKDRPPPPPLPIIIRMIL